MKKLITLAFLFLFFFSCGNGLGELLTTDEEETISIEEIHPPVNLTSSMCIYNSQIKLTWETIEKATSYEIYRSTDKINFTKIATSSSTSYTDNTSTTSLLFYKIKAINSQTQSSFSDMTSGMLKKSVSSQTYSFDSFIDGSSIIADTGDNDFNDPSGITIDSNHNIYISDTGNHRIKKYNSAGVFIGWWGLDDQGTASFHNIGSGRTSQSGNAEFAFKYPQKIFEKSGTLYIADTNNHRIQKIHSDHTDANYINWWGKGTTTSWNTGSGANQGSLTGELSFPFGMAIDSGTNSLFITNTFNHRIEKIDASNNITSLLKFGYTPETIRYIRDIKINNNKIYLADSYSIKVFDLSGNYLYSFGKMGTAQSEFFMLEGIELDENENIIVADTGNHRIQIFSNEGCHITTLGSFGTSNGKLSHPRDVTYDNNSGTKTIYITDSQNNRIQKWIQ